MSPPSVSNGTADVVDVVYVNIVTWTVGCVGVREVAKGEQLTANQRQELMGIHAMIKKAGSPSRQKVSIVKGIEK